MDARDTADRRGVLSRALLSRDDDPLCGSADAAKSPAERVRGVASSLRTPVGAGRGRCRIVERAHPWGPLYSLWAPSSLPSSRSNVPSGRLPALRAASRTRQSENPRAGLLRKWRSAAATTSQSCSVRSLWLSNISTAVAISGASRSYTADSTQVASASTRCDTQAPFATNVSAAATCLGSSRVTRRTRTLVSTARTPSSDVASNALLHLLEGARLGPAVGEQRSMHLFRRVAGGTPHDDLLALLGPFQDRARSHTELPTNFRRHGDLALGRQLGLRDGHSRNYHGNGMWASSSAHGSAGAACWSLRRKGPTRRRRKGSTARAPRRASARHRRGRSR